MTASSADTLPCDLARDRYDPAFKHYVPLKIHEHLVTNSPQTNLLTFPSQLRSELCWTSDSITKEQYIMMLTASDISAIDNAIAHFQTLGIALPLISPDTFPLPVELTDKIRHLSNILHKGLGFAVLRGLEPGRYTDEEEVLVFCGLASYVGLERSTNIFGMALNHVRSAVNDQKPHGREDLELQTPKLVTPLKFHADRNYGDIIALYVKSHAAVGGQQYLASFWTIYNELMSKSPQSLDVLAGDWPWPGVVNDQPATKYSPVIFHHEGNIFCQLVYNPFEGTNILKKDQVAALAEVEASAQKNCIEIDRQLGDIQFFNNLALLHARRSWIDRPHKARHYLRLGLRDPQQAWQRPPKHCALFDDCFEAPPSEQTIPVTDFDPYVLTAVEPMGHG